MVTDGSERRDNFRRNVITDRDRRVATLVSAALVSAGKANDIRRNVRLVLKRVGEKSCRTPRTAEAFVGSLCGRPARKIDDLEARRISDIDAPVVRVR